MIKIWRLEKKKSCQNLVNLDNLKNPLYRSKSYFSGRNSAKHFASKRNTAWWHILDWMAGFLSGRLLEIATFLDPQQTHPTSFFHIKKLKIYNFARIYGWLSLPWQDLSAKEKWIFSPVYFSFRADKFCHFCEERFSHRWQFITF